MRLDLHVHTRHSIDSLTEPKALAEKSRKLGIIPAITDHNSIAAHSEMRALKAEFIPGVEISTESGDLVGLYVSQQIGKGKPFLEVLDLIREQGGIAYLPHMYDRGRTGRHVSDDEAAKADVIEAFNARCMRKEYNDRAKAFAEKHGIPMAASSDSHWLFEFGSSYTELPDFDIGSPKALLKALNSKKARLVGKRSPIYGRGTTKIIAMARSMLRHATGKRP